jgi:hypothetical protein
MQNRATVFILFCKSTRWIHPDYFEKSVELNKGQLANKNQLIIGKTYSCPIKKPIQRNRIMKFLEEGTQMLSKQTTNFKEPSII